MRKFLKILLFLGLARFLGLIKELLLLEDLGATRELDILVYVTLLVVSAAGFMSSIIDNIVLPSIARYGESVIKRFNMRLVLLTILSLLFVTFVLILSGNKYITSGLIIVAVFCTLTISVSSYLGAILMARGGIENTKADFLPALMIIIYLTVFEVNEAKDIFTVFFIGNVAQMLVLWYFTAISHNDQLSKRYIYEKEKHVNLVVLAQLIVLSFPVLDSFFLINDEGSLASYGFSVRVVGVGMTMLATGATRTIVPNVSKLEQFEVGRIIKFICLVFLALLFVSLTIFFIPIPINTGSINIYLKILIFQLPFYVVNIIAVNIFIARFRYLYVFLIAIVGLMSKALFLIIFAQQSYAIIWSSVFSVVGPTLFLLLIYLYARSKNSVVYV